MSIDMPGILPVASAREALLIQEPLVISKVAEQAEVDSKASD